MREDPVPAVEWTKHYGVFDGNNTHYEYLPWTVAHEFGHTIGIDHGQKHLTLMSGYGTYPDDIWEMPPVGYTACRTTSKCGLTRTDREAARALYP